MFAFFLVFIEDNFNCIVATVSVEKAQIASLLQLSSPLKVNHSHISIIQVLQKSADRTFLHEEPEFAHIQSRVFHPHASDWLRIFASYMVGTTKFCNNTNSHSANEMHTYSLCSMFFFCIGKSHCLLNVAASFVALSVFPYCTPHRPTF